MKFFCNYKFPMLPLLDLSVKEDFRAMLVSGSSREFDTGSLEDSKDSLPKPAYEEDRIDYKVMSPTMTSTQSKGGASIAQGLRAHNAN